MCDPITLALMGTSVISGLMGLSKSDPGPPAPPTPAAPPPKEAGATVLVGDGKTTNTDGPTSVAQSGFTEKRKAGVALGGLGRSGLAL